MFVNIIYLPLYRGSIKVSYKDMKIYSVEYLDQPLYKVGNDIVSRLFEKYISGEKISFINLEIDREKISDFQFKVYRKVREIPYGEVRTYKWVAEEIGVNSPRAIGQALKRNPFLIVVPCHRIIKSNGEIGGFTSIGGINLKRYLLSLEGIKI